MRILIVRLSSIGDIVHTIPAAAAIKRSFPSARISWLANRNSSSILRNNPLLDDLIEVDTQILRRRDQVLGKTQKTAIRQFRELRASEFDLLIDFQGLLKSTLAGRLTKTKRRFGFHASNAREPASARMLTDAIQVSEGQNVIFRNIELAERALSLYLDEPEFKFDGGKPEFPIATGPDDVREAEAIIEQAAPDFAILNPGGGWPTKMWDARRFGELAHRISEEHGLYSVITTGPGEDHLADLAVGSSSSRTVLAAGPTLKGFFELARRARVYVGGDTGPTHLAVAAGCPVVGIYGPTEWLRNGSVDPEDICVERNDIGCRDNCYRRECGEWICMDISADTVASAVAARLDAGFVRASD